MSNNPKNEFRITLSAAEGHAVLELGRLARTTRQGVLRRLLRKEAKTMQVWDPSLDNLSPKEAMLDDIEHGVWRLLTLLDRDGHVWLAQKYNEYWCIASAMQKGGKVIISKTPPIMRLNADESQRLFELMREAREREGGP